VEKPKKTPLELATEEAAEQGERVRELKAKKAPKEEVDAAVKRLLEAKEKVKSLGGDVGDKKKGGDKEKKDAKAAAPKKEEGAKKEKKEKKEKKPKEAAAEPAAEAGE